MLQIATWKRLVIWGLVLFGLYFSAPNGFYERVEIHNDAVKQIEAVGSSAELEADRSAWPEWAPNELVNLGLDLRGGAHLLAEVQVADVYDTRMDSFWPELRNLLRESRSEIGTIRRQDAAPGELRVRISKPEALPRAIELAQSLAQPVVSVTSAGATDIEVKAGTTGEFIVTLSEAERAATDNRTILQSLEIIRRRVDEVGTREPTLQRQGENRILIQVPGIGSASELKEIIGKTAKLTFNPVVNSSATASTEPGPRNALLPSVDNPDDFIVVEKSAVVTGEELSDAQPTFDQNSRPAVSFRFNVGGARKFCEYTGANVGAPFAIVLDDEVISAPRINEAICGGSGIITGNFSVEESTKLAVLLRAGALPAELVYVEERTIGPELGQDSIDAGKIASIAAFLAVLVFMVIAYTWFGVVANIALICNVALIFGLLSLFGATLTLPGIAGIVLTIGMAVDANVLVFERIREELKAGRGPARAIELGYEKALSAILDANITTFITAAILFAMGSGPVRGFAVTLAIGIATSVFTAIFLTRLMLIMWFERKRPRSLKIKGISLVPNGRVFEFFKRTNVTFGASTLAMLASIGFFLAIGLNFGIDFKGGTTIRTESSTALDVATYRAALIPLELGDISIVAVNDVNFRDDQHVSQIRIQAQQGQEAITPETMKLIMQALTSVDPAVTFPSVESVGPKVSGELISAAILAVVAAIGAVLIYIWLRFEWQFALGAVAALVHDVLLTIGVFSLLGIKFDLAIIAALLTIVGYSLNDTVVVFDRVRENLRRYKKLALQDVLNLSINETLSRTILTSVTTLLALVALFVLGGDVIRGFVFAMMWGVLVGTYSSIFVASAILHRLGVKRDWTKQKAPSGNQFSDIDA